MSVVIRPATADDAEAINAIFNEAVLTSTAAWDHDPWSLERRQQWLTAHAASDQAVLVADVDGRVAGFAAYGAFRPQQGYARTQEHSVYVDASARGLGLGRALLGALIEEARARGVRVLIGALSADNEVSVKLHEALGFVEVAVIPGVGEKFGRVLDLTIVQKVLDEGHDLAS